MEKTGFLARHINALAIVISIISIILLFLSCTGELFAAQRRPTPTSTPSPTASQTVTASPTVSQTPSPSPSPTFSQTLTPNHTVSATSTILPVEVTPSPTSLKGSFSIDP